MSFSNQNVVGLGLKKFESEGEIQEKKKKRQEEWEKVRKQDDPEECPEEAYDPRSLFEQLEDQKQKKQDGYDEEHRLRNQVQGLGEEEAQFLNYVSDRQMEIDKQRKVEAASILHEMRDAQLVTIAKPREATAEEKKSVKPQVGSSQGKSQMALLAGAIKRKSIDTQDEAKKRKMSNGDSPTKSTSANDITRKTALDSSENSVARVIGVLPGLGEYDNDTSDSETSSSDSDIELSARNVIIVQSSK